MIKLKTSPPQIHLSTPRKTTTMKVSESMGSHLLCCYITSQGSWVELVIRMMASFSLAERGLLCEHGNHLKRGEPSSLYTGDVCQEEL